MEIENNDIIFSGAFAYRHGKPLLLVFDMDIEANDIHILGISLLKNVV